jgi:hypothetical protein
LLLGSEDRRSFLADGGARTVSDQSDLTDAPGWTPPLLAASDMARDHDANGIASLPSIPAPLHILSMRERQEKI